MGKWKIINDRIEDVDFAGLGAFDACLCDPPYGLGFMGKSWDHGVPSSDVWSRVNSALKPGAHLMAFGGTRTFHRLTSAIEDAGFEIRDCMMWLYGSGFPKSHNLHGEFEGYGTALKPAWEPCIVAMKPLDGTFAQNAIRHGVAGLNIDSGRIATTDKLGGGMENGTSIVSEGWDRPWRTDPVAIEKNKAATADKIAKAEAMGRWPANLILDESFEQEWARFFYCAKASRRERDAGLGGFEARMAKRTQSGGDDTRGRPVPINRNYHPCLKPLDLNRYLASLILPPKRDTPRRVMVPFSGSGSEMIGCLMAGWDEVVGIEMDSEYCKIAEARIRHWTSVDMPLFEDGE